MRKENCLLCRGAIMTREKFLLHSSVYLDCLNPETNAIIWSKKQRQIIKTSVLWKKDHMMVSWRQNNIREITERRKMDKLIKLFIIPMPNFELHNSILVIYFVIEMKHYWPLGRTSLEHSQVLWTLWIVN